MTASPTPTLPQAARQESCARTILHVIHTSGPGGAETVVLNLARGMHGRNWRSLVTIPSEGWLGPALAAGGITPKILSDANRIAYFRGLIQHIRREHVDLIHAHLLGSATYAAMAGLLCRVPIVATFHGHSDVTPHKLLETVRFALIRGAVSKIVLVSEPLRQVLLDTGRVSSSEVDVIPNGVDTTVFQPTVDRSFRREIGFPDDVYVVGVVGNIRPAKDYPNFLRAAALLVQSSPTYRFVIAGQGRDPLLGDLLGLRDELGLSAHVVFAGFQADIPRVLNSCDTLVISSSSEGFSLAAIQGMACGVPVVATRCGGPEQILEDGVDGVLVEVRSPQQIAVAVERVRLDARFRQTIATQALAKARSKFSLDRTVLAYDSLYSAILEEVAS